ncbi:MAG: sulfite exporter TauE/SafE family protein [Halothece sp. Uz-M2-17]|nr:sulfite exporter TauE/SafE family protein [Halothece sp. Uz-M2-17]
MENLWLLAGGGLFSGLLAGLLGIGGGTVLVPIIITVGYSPVQAVATSSLAIVLTAVSGSLQNYRMGYLDLQRVWSLGFPAILTAQLGAYVASDLPDRILLFAFGFLLIINIFLASWRKTLAKQEAYHPEKTQHRMMPRVATGGLAGFLAGLFGIGGGVIMVPLQMVLLGEPIKVAIQTSLGVIVITAISATVGHTWQGNVLFWQGFVLGLGGLIGAQISTRYLPKLRDRAITFGFYSLLVLLAIYTFWRASLLTN